jgi:GNAT superfamily N-acetyltransferase
VAVTIERVADLDADWPSIAALYEEFEAYNQAFEQRTLAPDWQRRLRERLRLHGDRAVLLANDGASAAGFIVAGIRREDGLAAQTTGYLSFAYVREQYRRQGIGRALLAEAEAWCRERGAPRVELDVFMENAAGREFWQDCGYRPISMTLTKAFKD